MSFLAKIRQQLKPAVLYQKLKGLYYKLAPLNSRRYQLTNTLIRQTFKKFQLLNIYYRKWIKAHDTYAEDDIEKIKQKIASMTPKPLISVVMPVYNPEIRFFEEAIQSVKSQLYHNWELCIADDASTDPRVPEIIKAYADGDPRIKYTIRQENGHISACSNSALTLATGEFIALLDHDDKLHPLALYAVAQTINHHPDCGIIFSDEDKITKRGKRLDPYFKPDFDYDLLLSHNMVSHLGVYRLDILRKIGGFRIGLEGSQDYDLLLRTLEQINPGQIHHIPRILYHWRISKHSVAESLNIKPYAIQAGERAINEHLERRGVKGTAEFLPDSAGYRINYHLPEPPPQIALIIPNWEPSEAFEQCVDEILSKTTYKNYQIILVQPKNKFGHVKGSNHPWQDEERVTSFQISPDVTVPQAINDCVSEISADYVGFLNSNLAGFSPMWLTSLVSQAAQKDMGCVAPKLLDINRYVYSNGIILTPDQKIHHLFNGKPEDFIGYFGWGKLRKGYSALSDKCILIKKSHFKAVKGFDTAFSHPLVYTVDLCLKLKALGLKNILCPSIKLYRRQDNGYNSKQNGLKVGSTQLEFELLQQKWEMYFSHDPGFNPNLTLAEDGEILVNLSPNVDNSEMWFLCQ